MGSWVTCISGPLCFTYPCCRVTSPMVCIDGNCQSEAICCSKSLVAQFSEAVWLKNTKLKCDVADGGGYQSKQVFKADERGIYLKGIPSRMSLTKEEMSASGCKPSKNGDSSNCVQILEPLVVWSSGSQHGPCSPPQDHTEFLSCHMRMTENSGSHSNF